jgi:hypothetical protein
LYRFEAFAMIWMAAIGAKRTFGKVGRLSEAREFAARQAIGPGGPWLVIGQMFTNPEHRELVLSGLRLAAGEA